MPPSDMPPDGEVRLRRACGRLEAALRAGEDLRSEDLLKDDPVLAADPEAAVELIYTEFVVRERLSQAPAIADWMARFPAWRSELEEVFQVHEMLDTAELLQATTSPPGRPGPRHAPRKVGAYEIDEELGRGGMGVVYRGRQTQLNRVVAVKVILSGSHASLRELERFRREAETAAQLDHPHIVRVYEVGEHDGHPFCAMEFVAGGTLRGRMNGAPWPQRTAAELVELLARAVQHAHERGVIHRDLKPDNILMGGDSEADTQSDGPVTQPQPPTWCSDGPKIADFGLAKRIGESDAGPTRTGDVLGTPAYMAPEQAEGRVQEVGAAADLWALGVILYELLTGHAPFQGDSEADIFRAISRDEPPPPRTIRPRLPRDLDTICLKCLEKSPQARYASAAALADDLHRWLHGEPIQARPVGLPVRVAKWVRRHPATAAWLGVVMLLFVATFVLVASYAVRADRRRREADAARLQAQQARDAVQRVLYGQQVARAFFEWQTCNPEEAGRLLKEARAAGPGWEWSYVDGLCHTDLMTLTPHAEMVAAVAYSPDRRVLATASGGWAGRRAGEVRLWDPDTGRLLRVLGDGRHAPVMGIAYRPDGRVVASAGVTFNSGQPGGVTYWDAATGAEIGSLAGLEKGAFCVAFSPDGRWLAVGDVAGEVTLWNAETRSLVARFGKHRRPNVFAIAFSPDGQRLASGGWDGTVRIWDVESRREEQVLEAPTDVRGVAFSPDGRHVAAASYSNAVVVWRIGRNEPVVIHTHHANPVSAVAFSPDGLYLASADNSGMVHVYQAFSKIGRPLTVRGHSGGVASLTFRSDGLRLVTGGYDGTARVWDPWTPQEFGGLEARQLPISTSLAYRPDGKRLAAACSFSENRLLPIADIRVWDAETGALNLTLRGHRGGVTGIAYSPDGALLASSSMDGTVRLWDLQTGASLATFQGHTGPVHDVAFPNAGWIVSIGKDGTARVWDLKSRREARSIDLGVGALTRLALHPGQELVAVGAANGSVFWRDAHTLASVGSDRRHTGKIEALAFHPNGRELASAGEDREIIARTLSGGRSRSLGAGHTGTVVGLAYSPDGHRLASASHDCSIRLWDLADGADRFSFRPQRGRALSVAFRPDGRQLAAGVQAEGQVNFWGIESTSEERLARAEAAGKRWDRSSVTVAMQNRLYDGARFHYDRLITAEPQRANWRAGRGEALAALGRFEEAIADFDHAAEAGMDQATSYFRALCHAACADRERYQAACRRAIERSKSATRSALVNEAAWTCALRDDSGVEPAAVVALAERALTLDRNNVQALNTLGLALVRAGRYEDAVTRLRESIERNGKPGIVEDWTVLAMAEHHLGQHDEARRSLERAAALEKAAPDEGPRAPNWSERLSQGLLRDEAARLLGLDQH